MSLADKHITIAENMQKVYEAGKQAGGGSGGDDALKTLVSSIIDRSVTEITPEDVDALGITKAAWSSFERCTSLKRFISTSEQGVAISNNAFDNCTSLLEAHIGAVNGSSSFVSCSKLQKVVIYAPTTFAWGVFSNCTSLKVVDCRTATKIPTIGAATSQVFQNVPTGCQIVVPDSLYDAWSTATNWVSFTNIVIVKASDYVEYEVVE